MKTTLRVLLCMLAFATTAKMEKGDIIRAGIDDAYIEGLITERQAENLRFNNRDVIYNTSKNRMGGTAIISGFVADDMAAPIPNHHVRLWIKQGGFWGYQDQQLTGGSGDFSFTGLPAGEYAVSIGGIDDDYIDYMWDDTASMQRICSA